MESRRNKEKLPGLCDIAQKYKLIVEIRAGKGWAMKRARPSKKV